mmetsp:Transcript_9005/g.23190  ORF Transcript_9005/g.23190 Transcript_9005/m.23190 type:complete len:208 (+) Transcript_9005:765-1388(+)
MKAPSSRQPRENFRKARSMRHGQSGTDLPWVQVPPRSLTRRTVASRSRPTRRRSQPPVHGGRRSGPRAIRRLSALRNIRLSDCHLSPTSRSMSTGLITRVTRQCLPCCTAVRCSFSFSRYRPGPPRRQSSSPTPSRRTFTTSQRRVIRTAGATSPPQSRSRGGCGTREAPPWCRSLTWPLGTGFRPSTSPTASQSGAPLLTLGSKPS